MFSNSKVNDTSPREGLPSVYQKPFNNDNNIKKGLEVYFQERDIGCHKSFNNKKYAFRGILKYVNKIDSIDAKIVASKHPELLASNILRKRTIKTGSIEIVDNGCKQRKASIAVLNHSDQLDILGRRKNSGYKITSSYQTERYILLGYSIGPQWY